MSQARTGEEPEPLADDITVDVQVDAPFEDLVDPAPLAAAVAATLRHQGRHAGEVALVVADDQALQALNRDFLGIDAPTDVLSFPALDAPVDGRGSFVIAPEAATFLGDIIISYPTAARQAEAAGFDVAGELCLLTVHGTLHLLGHDHAEPGDKTAMWAAQEAVLAALGVAVRPLLEE